MYRFIWMTLCLLNCLGVYAEERADDTQWDETEWFESYETRSQLDQKQKKHSKGLSFAVIGFDGGNPNCTFIAGPGVVQTVIDAGYEEIRLVRGTHSGNIDISDQSINIKGKYATCVAAQLDTPSEQPTHISTLSGVSGAALPTVRISGNSQRNTVLFKNLEIIGGEVAQFLTGGGIDVRLADVNLTLDTVQVRNNQGRLGGGLSISFDSTNVSLIDSLIALNTSLEGGGVYCSGAETTINMRDTGPENPSGIALNEATDGNGGGLYIENGCDFQSTSGSYGSAASGGLDLNGIVANSATNRGGGVYARTGAQVTLDGARKCGNIFCSGNNDSNVRVSANTADSDDDNDGSGGGIYATGENTTVSLTNAVIADNSAFNGGGFSATDKADILMSSFYTSELTFPPPPGDKCWSPGSCSQIIGNEAEGLGGGIEVINGAYAFIDRTVVQQNRANNAAAIYVLSGSTPSDISVFDMTGSLVTNNGAGGTGGFSDFNAITLTGGQAFITYTTLADNDVQGSVIGTGANGLLNIRSSIIHQMDGLPTYQAFNPNQNSGASCLILSSLDDFDPKPFSNIVADNPEFVNRSGGDFHLSDGSPAIDSCLVASAGKTSDLDGDTRGWDDPAIPNDRYYTLDIGYDENFRLIADLIFKDGFEQQP